MQNTILQFKHIIVDSNNPADPHCKAVADIDNDGYGELLVASSSGEGLFWYHYPSWSKHKIADGSFTTDMATGDIDGDGYIDVVIPGNEGLMWYRNPMGWRGNPKDPWKATNISSKGANMHDIEVIDLDNDGKFDIVTRHRSKGFWQKHIVAVTGSHNIILFDVDNDGLVDIFGANWNNRSLTGGRIELWLNRSFNE